MFDENFSFLSSTSNTHSPAFDDCTSSEVSPFTSRSSSPRPYHRNSSISTNTSHPLPRRDSRFNSVTSIPRNPSVAQLTAQLETHALSPESPLLTDSPTTSRPSYTDFSDEGFVDGSNSSIADFDDDFDPSLWASDLSITSSPRNSLGENDLPSFALRRRQRQALVRLQCLAQRAPQLMMLIEECHPSSIPLPDEPVWSMGTKRQYSASTSSIISARVEKEKTCVSVRRTPRMRKRQTR